MLEKNIETIEKNFKGYLLRNKLLRPYPEDIDLYIPKRNRKKALTFLKNEGYILKEYSLNKAKMIKFINAELYVLDINFSFNYIFKFFKNVELKKSFIEKYLENTKKYEIDMKLIRYFYELRFQDKYVNYIVEHFDILQKNNFYCKQLNKSVFKKKVLKNDIEKLMNRKLFYLLKYLNIFFVLSFYRKRLNEKISKINSGKIIAILGPDGSGKTNLINNLMKFSEVRTIYFGNKNFLFEKQYNYLLKKGFIFKILRMLLIFLENYYRYFKAYKLKLKGFIVITDRYPKFERLNSPNLTRQLNSVFYFFFPNANNYIFLFAKPEKILENKKELSVEEINTVNNYFNKFKEIIIVDALEGDKTYNDISKIIFKIINN